MFSLRKNFKLEIDEDIITIVRHYVLTYFFQILLILILILAPFFLFFILISEGKWGMSLFGLLLASGLIYGWRQFIKWYFNVFIITNKRIVDIDQRGFFNRVVSEVSFNDIADLSYSQQGLRQTFFHYGNVEIMPQASKIKLVMSRVRRPGEIHKLINDLMHQARENLAPRQAQEVDLNQLTEPELIILLGKIKEKLPAKKFLRAIKRLLA